MRVWRLAGLRELGLKHTGNTVLPPGRRACRQLSWLEVGSDVAAPVVGSLKSLRFLSISTRSKEQQHWTQLTALTELCLNILQRRPIPAGLGGMTGHLSLKINDGEHALPPGPYLSRLGRLSLAGYSIPGGLTAVLAAAKQLRYLSFKSSSFYQSSSDVAMLSCLPALETLRNVGCRKGDSAGQLMWDEGLAELRARCAAQGREPPVILEDACN